VAERNRTRLLVALVGIAIAMLLVARFVIRKEAREEPELDDGEALLLDTTTIALPSSFAPGASGASGAASAAPRHARYESALISTRIDGLSSGAGTALAVGEGGTILRYEIEHPTWRSEASPTRSELRAVAQQLDEAIAVGDDGVIAERDESGNWTLAAPVTKRTLRAVVYSSYGAIAVGDGGTIVRRVARHEPWRVEPSATTRDLFGACSGLRDVWVVGAGGAVLSRTIDAWNMQTIGAADWLAVACDDRGGLAVGKAGAMIARSADVAWHDVPSGVTSDLFAVSAPIGTRSFLVVGASGTVLHVAGAASAEPASFDVALRAVSEGALGTWVAGDAGIFRRVPE